MIAQRYQKHISSGLIAGVLALMLAISGCSRKDSGHNHAGHDHDHDHDHGGEHMHAHHAPHGGTLVEVGEHQFNLEFVVDPVGGRLTAYVLDAHAENFIRVGSPSLEIHVVSPAPARVLILNAVANAATGETVGDTSQFEGSADWLKGVKSLSGTVARLEVRGANFVKVPVTLTPAQPGGK